MKQIMKGNEYFVWLNERQWLQLPKKYLNDYSQWTTPLNTNEKPVSEQSRYFTWSMFVRSVSDPRSAIVFG